MVAPAAKAKHTCPHCDSFSAQYPKDVVKHMYPKAKGTGKRNCSRGCPCFPGCKDRHCQKARGKLRLTPDEFFQGVPAAKQAGPRSAMLLTIFPLTPYVSPVQGGQDVQEQPQPPQAGAGDPMDEDSGGEQQGSENNGDQVSLPPRHI